MYIFRIDLFGVPVVGSDKAVALAEYGGVLASANGVHFPLGVIVV